MSCLKKGKSVLLSIILCYIFLSIGVAATITAPIALDHYIIVRGLTTMPKLPLLVAFYACLVPAYITAYSLLKLLYNIRDEQVFTNENVRLIRVISIMCAIVFFICFAAGFIYPTLFLVCAVAGFMSIILKVVKNCFAAAVELRADNELTI